MNHALPFVASVLLALSACGSGAGSGAPCETKADCAPEEDCVLTSCEATSATCEITCASDDECAGGTDSTASGDTCLEAADPDCLDEAPGGQSGTTSYCVE